MIPLQIDAADAMGVLEILLTLVGGVIVAGFWTTRRLIEKSHAEATVLLELLVEAQKSIATSLATASENHLLAVEKLAEVERQGLRALEMHENADRYGFGSGRVEERLTHMDHAVERNQAALARILDSIAQAINAQNDYTQQLAAVIGTPLKPHIPKVETG